MDPRTAMVAVQLQLDDIAELLNDMQINKDKKIQDEERASLETIQQDLVQQLATLEGQVLVIKILKQEFDDRAAYKKLLDEEKQAVSDHELAMRLAGMSFRDTAKGSKTTSKAQHDAADDYEDDAQWEMAKQLYASAFEGNEIHSALEDEANDHRALADRAPLHGIRTVKAEQADVSNRRCKDFVKCNACMEPFDLKDTLRLQCHHTYCRGCLKDLFTSAISETALFPPRCCRVPIPLDTCRIMLSKGFIKEFDLKVEELATPNPTYCANPDCSKFVRPGDITAKVANCVFCQTKTCEQCKNVSHQGLCPQDPHVQLLMDVAKRSKWQQCKKCHNMVELEVGCFHMTCRCSHEFCYLCGGQWKRCSCPQWEEDYLTRTTAHPPVARQARARTAVARRNRPHQHNWQRHGGGVCEVCDADYLPWIMRCEGCNSDRCWRCTHNRT